MAGWPPAECGCSMTVLPVCPSIILSIRLSVHPSVRASVCLSIRLSIPVSICPSICPSVHLSVHPSIHPTIHGSPAEPDPTRGYRSNPSLGSCHPLTVTHTGQLHGMAFTWALVTKHTLKSKKQH